jgi:PKD repeat protein
MRRARQVSSALALVTLAALGMMLAPVGPAAAVDIGPLPGACPTEAYSEVGPYPASHAYCVRTHHYATLSVDAAEVGNGSEFTLTLALNLPRCTFNGPIPCVDTTFWGAGDAVGSGPSYRLIDQTKTYFRVIGNKNYYYVPFNTTNVSGNGACTAGSNAFAESCRYRVDYRPPNGVVPPAWAVWNMRLSIKTRTQPTSAYDSIWLEAVSRVIGEAVNQTPTASFTWAPHDDNPLTVDFDASASSDDTGIATYAWDFGDGQGGSGVKITHPFAGPGIYPVRLTVTDTQGATNSVTKQVIIAPKLDVEVSLLADDDRLELGEEFDVAVTVKSLGDGGGDLSSLEFVDAVLDVGDTGRVVVVSGPTPVPPATFSLQPGESESFAFRLRAEAAGPVTLSSTVQGEDANGEPVEASDSRQLRVGGLLDVAVVANPSAIDLEDDNTGHKEVPVTAVVTVTNIHSQPISNVVLDPLDLRSRRLPAPVPASLVVLSGPSVQGPLPQPPDPSALGTIQPGESVTRFFSLEARNDGHYDVQAIVRAADPVSGGTLVESGMGEVKIVADVVFYFESVPLGAEDRNGALWKPGGLHWEVQGKMENRSPDKQLLVVLLPKLIGNAFYGLPIIEGTNPPDDVCAMGTARSMPKGEKLTFKAPVRTLADGGTRGIYQLVPQVLIENPNGTRTPVSEDQILIKPGSTEHTVHVDVGIPPPPERSLDELYGARLLGTVEGLGRFAEGIWDLAVMAGKVVKFGLQPWQWDDAYRVAGDKVAGYLVDLYENVPDHEKQMFNDDLGDAVAIALGGVYNDVSGLVNKAAEQRFTELANAYYSGDSFEVARWFGRLEGELAPEVALEVLTGGLAVCKLGARGRRTVEAALEAKAASQAASLERRAAEGARALKNHDILDYERHLRGIFGIDRVSDRMFREFAKTWKVVLVFRRRGVGVLEKLRTGKFTLKPFAIKAKSVDHIDNEFLGLRLADSTPTPPGPSLADEVVIGEPPPWSEVQAKLGGRDSEFVEEVRERWTTRWEEWHGKGAHPETGAGGVGGEKAEWLIHELRGSVPYSKQNVAGIQENIEKGISIPMDDTAQTWKGFRIERTTGPEPHKRQIWRCQIEDNIKGWQGVTGDLDLMAITRADGTPIPPEARIKMYRALRHLGIQHPETLTWTDKVKLRKYLDEFGTHNPNSEAMAAYMPDGKNVIATRYVDGQSWINPLDPKNSAKFFYDGATMAIRAEAVTPNDMQHLENEAQAVPAVYIAPDTWTFIRPGCGGGGVANASLGDVCVAPLAVQFTNDPDSLIVRQPAPGVLERWTPETGWQPLPWGETTIRVRPQTSLSQPAPAGASILEINDLSLLGLAPDVNAWFQVGQRVVINPGGVNEETVTIVGFGSLHLAEPLRFDHQAGELVTALDGTAGRLPVIRRLSGHQLAMKYKASKPTSRKLVVASKDKTQTDLGDAANVATLLAEGGSLRLVAVGGDGFDVQLPLPASGWKAIRKKHPEKGIRFRGTGGVRSVIIKPGKQLVVKGAGADLAFTLVEEPETVQAQVAIGDRRMCLAFPRPGKFVAEKQLVRVRAAQAPSCPAE